MGLGVARQSFSNDQAAFRGCKSVSRRRRHVGVERPFLKCWACLVSRAADQGLGCGGRAQEDGVGEARTERKVGHEGLWGDGVVCAGDGKEGDLIGLCWKGLEINNDYKN